MSINLNAALSRCVEIAQMPDNDSLLPFLPLFRFEQKPYHLKYHFQLEPLFQKKLSRRTVLMSARQIGKTHNVAASCILRSALKRNYHILLCEPQFDQTKRLSTVVAKDLIEDSYIYPMIQNSRCTSNVLLKEFLNGSRIYFTYCGEDATRVRGIAGIYMCLWDECADMHIDVMNIVAETMSAVPGGGIYAFTGTPTYTDNTLAVLFSQSSQGHLHFKCEGCNRTNIAAPGYDIHDMIGKHTCICVKCGKPLDTRTGWYEFERPDLRGRFDGFHIPQITHPLHATDREKWSELLYKREMYPPAQFDNEVLGIPSDEAVKLISREDLEKASHGRPNTMEEALNTFSKYTYVGLGVDWGGGGVDMVSHTTIAVAGYLPLENRVDILYMYRLPRGKNSIEEVEVVLSFASQFRVDFIAHDVAAAGKEREDILVQISGGVHLVVPFRYVWAPRQDMLKYNPPSPGYRGYYSLDKTRSLTVMITAIKHNQIKVPTYNSAENLFKDFQSLGEEIRPETDTRSASRVITRTGVNPDDMAHSANFVSHAMWNVAKQQPRLSGR